MPGGVTRSEVRPPLHRLAPLHADPAFGWLSPEAIETIGIAEALPSSLYVLGLLALFAVVQGAFSGPFHLLQAGVQFALVVTLAVGSAPARQRAVAGLKHRRLQRLVRQVVAAEALPVDEWAALEGVPDGRVVALVGRARAGACLATPVGGRPCIGVALGCTQQFPGVFESLHDFELVDGQGRSIPIQVSGGRLLGAPNIPIFGDEEGRGLIASLQLPAGVVPAREAFALRDGSILKVVGVKTTFVDPAQPGMRQAPLRIAIASSPTRPLLIYPVGPVR